MTPSSVELVGSSRWNGDRRRRSRYADADDDSNGSANDPHNNNNNNHHDHWEYGSDLDQENIMVPRELERQNYLCGCLYFLVLSSLTVFLVGRFYMTTPHQALESLRPRNRGDNSTAMTTSSTVAGTLTSNLTDHGSGTTQSDLQSWLNNHGRVPNVRPKEEEDADADASPASPKESPQSSTQAPVLFQRRKWLNSKVTLEDGPMFTSIRELEHDGGAFLEGLTLASTKGDSTRYLFESTGLHGQSSIRKLDPLTGRVMEKYDMEDSKLFGEGLTYANNGKLYQLTYKRKLGFIYDVNNISQPVDTFHFESTTGEGWGLTYAPDTKELIMSDGSHFLHMLDRDTLEPTRKVRVQRDGNKRADNLNELEYFHGRVLANVWFEDIILVIHPETGVVEKEYDFSSLWPESERRQRGAGVLNGISVSDHPGHIYVTGKNWERMFLVE